MTSTQQQGVLPKPTNGNGGTINEKTKLPLSFVIPLVAFVVSAALAYASQLRELDSLRREQRQCRVDLTRDIDGVRTELEKHDTEDHFRGADADRWHERIQWAWEYYARNTGLKCYPLVPPWREGTSYHPKLIYIEGEKPK